MNFNFNPLTYDFTSSIPDVFEMSDFQGSSVYLAIYLNRSQLPVFSTTLYAHGGKASIYDLRSIIENYMEAKQLVHATCSFRMQVDRTDYTLGEFTLVYCKLQMLRTNCDLLFSKILRTFAVTVPTTLPIEQRTRVGLLLFIRTRYSKQPLDYPEILNLLKSRGLIICDESMAIECLKVVSYFRLDNYFHPMESDKIRHIFKPNSYFENAVDLYEFDRDLRELIFTAIQAIEIALRSKMIHHISLRYGAFWFTNTSLFRDANIHRKCMERVRLELGRTREEFIIEHVAKYSEPDVPPVWKTLEVTSFGTLSKLFCNFSDNPIKKRIAREFNLPQHLVLESWIKSAVVLRNYLAHHSRVWNRKNPIKPNMTTPLRGNWVTPPIGNYDKLYSQLCYLQYLLNVIRPNNDFTQRLHALLSDHPNVDIAAMGFPLNWQDQPLWR